MVARQLSLFIVFLLTAVSAWGAPSRGPKFAADVTPTRASATVPYSLDLTTLLSDPGVGTLQWSTFSDKPAWLTLDSPNHRLSGTAALTDVGTTTFRIAVKDNDSGAIAQIQLTVVITPVWAGATLDLGTAKEDSPFTFDLTKKVTVPGNGPVTISVEDPAKLPKWLTLGTNGVLTGTPRRADVGDFSGVVFVATTPSGGVAKTTAFGTVQKTIHPPKWTATSFTLDNAAEDFPYAKDVSGATYVSNFEGAPLTFTLTTGTASGWLTLSAAGALSGTPGKIDVGAVQVQAKLSGVIDGQTYTDTTTLKLTVIHTNHAPKWSAVTVPGATVGIAYSQSLAGFASDVDGDPLSFSLVSGPAWATVSAAGVLAGTPRNADMGTATFTVRVSDGALAADATFSLTVTKRPVVWTNKPIQFPDAHEDVFYSQNLLPLVTNPDGDLLTFSLVSGPAWLTVTPSGVLAGTPAAADVGPVSLQLKVSNGLTPDDTTAAVFTVVHTNHAPYWTENPIPLPDINERVPFTTDLSGFAKDKDTGDTLVFSKIAGPAWAQVSSTGQLFGTPARPNVGINTFVVRVTDNGGLSSDVTVTVTVLKVPLPPRWTQNPIALPDATQDTPYSFALAPLAVDDEGLPMTFKKVSGPDWLVVSSDGKVSGTPALKDVGAFTAVFEVADANLAAQANGNGKVIKKFYPPVVHQAALSFTVKERSTFQVSLNQKQYVEDVNGDPLTFSLVDTAPWLTLGTDGSLTASPKFGDIGPHTFKFTVTNGVLSSNGTMTINVVRDPRPPVWVQAPAFEAKARVPFTASVATAAKDLDGLPVTFSKKSGPAWLQVAADGTLSGTPQDSDLGDNAFVLTVKNDQLGADGPVTVKVVFNPHPPVINASALVFTVKERSTFAISLNQPQFVTNQDGRPLTFSLDATSDWLKLAPNGDLTATPLFKDIGTYSYAFHVNDGILSASGAIKVTVVRDPRPPVWLQNPISFDARARVAFSATLADKARDLDGFPITFKKTSGPAWLQVAANGALSGTPADSDVGDGQFVVTVANDKLGADASVVIHVQFNPHPPVIQQANLKFTVKERSTFSVSLNQPQYVQNVDGTPLVFKLIDTPSWVALAANGDLTATPAFVDIGDHDYKFQVANGDLVAVGTLHFTVLRDPRPPVWLQNPVTFETKARMPFAGSLAAQAKDLDGFPISFAKKSGPAWLTVKPNGDISGTPQDSDLGDNSFVVTVSNDKLGADGSVIVKVLFNNHAPTWTQNPITLPSATGTVAYSQSVAGFAKDPDAQDTLTFSKVSGPAWVQVSATGQVTGTPAVSDIGLTSFDVKVSDPSGLSAVATVKITVVKPNSPPKWVQNPIQLTDALEDTGYAFNLGPLATDDDNDPLTFRKVSGPDWLVVAADGSITGTPHKADIGDFTAVFEVTDGKAAVQAQALGRVLHKHHPPIVHQEALSFTVKERSTLQVALNQKQYVESTDGDPLTFTLIDTPDWVTLSPTGDLKATPQFKNIGDNAIKFQVANGPAVVAGVINIKVLRDPRPPVWTQNPITFETKAREPFLAGVFDKAKDLDNLSITFSKTSGPAWLQVDQFGTLTGTPQDANVGDNTFVLTARNDLLGADVTVIVKVLFNNHAPTFVVNPITLPNVTAGVAYAQTVAPYAKDQDGDKLTFAKVDGPAWVQVAPDGTITGTPAIGDVGPVSFQVSVTDPAGLSATATVKLNVLKPNAPPKWLQNPIQLTDATADTPFTFDLAPLAVDDDGDPLTFRKVSGPDWLLVAGNGAITGTPKKTDVGDFAAVFEVSDGKAAVQASARGKVLPKAHPPVIHQDQLVFQIKERATFQVALNQAQYVEDPDGNPLTFTLVDTRDWLKLEANGNLTATPKFKDIGKHSLKFTASNGYFTSTGTLEIEVVRDPRAPEWQQNPIRFTATARVAFQATVGDKVKDLDGLPLVITKKSGPAWLSVSPAGSLSGTPTNNDVGDNVFVLTARNDVLGADVTVIVTVSGNNHPPVWSQNPVVLPDAKVNTAYVQSVAAFVTDADGDPITFTKVSGPDWVFVSSTGAVIGTPGPTDVGQAVVKIQAADPWGASAQATAYIQVQPNLHPPQWLKDPIPLGDARVGQAFAFDLAPFAKDPDGNPLTFRLVSGPTWLVVAADGKITGTPQAADVGAFTAVFETSNGTLVAQVNGYGQVLPQGNQPPVVEPQALRFVVKERQTLEESLNQPKYVHDPDGDPLTFTLTNPEPWITLTKEGKLTLKPLAPQVGDHTFGVTIADDHGHSVDAAMFVRVLSDPLSPMWLQDPIRMTAIANVPFTNTLADKAKDPGGAQLTFSKKAGPGWLTVSPNGALSGTPGSVDFGPNIFTVTARNSAFGADATLIITVTDPEPQSDTVQIDEAVPNAPAENLWIVDNSYCGTGKNPLVMGLKNGIQAFFDKLEAAKIAHTGAYLSSDFPKWQGVPIPDKDGNVLFGWKDSSLADRFIERLGVANSGHCNSSPIWTMFQIDEKAPTFEIYHNGYFTQGAPMDALIVTLHADQYKTFAKKTEQQSWKPADYADSFIAFERKEGQPYRISAVAPECPSREPLAISPKENPYRVLVDKTHGQYFTHDCNFDMDKALAEYADQIIFRAYVSAKRRVKLSKTPFDPAGIKVSIGGKALPSSVWSYDATKNEIVVRWELIDFSTLKAGDKLKVEYKG